MVKDTNDTFDEATPASLYDYSLYGTVSISPIGDPNISNAIIISLEFNVLCPYLNNLQEIMVEHANTYNEPLCGLEEMSFVAGIDSVGDTCVTEIVEDNIILEEGARFPSNDLHGADVVREEYVYVWKQSGYFRQVVHDICLSCDKEVFLVQPDDVLLMNDKKLIVQLNGNDVKTNSFYELKNNSLIACNEVHSIGNPLNTRVPVIVTVLIISVSLISLIITFITYCVFAELRNLPGKITMNYIVALFITLVSVLIDLVLPKYACVAAGAVFHFCWLAAFTWMNGLSINTTRALTRTTPMRKTSSNKRLYMYMAYGWGAPMIIVIITLALHFCDCTDVEIGYGAIEDDELGQSCWMQGLAEILLYTVIVSILLVINLVLFCYTLYKVLKVTKDIRSRQEKNEQGSHWEYWIFIKVCNYSLYIYKFAAMSTRILLDALQNTRVNLIPQSVNARAKNNV